MARLSRMYYSNAVYHVCIRGNNKRAILISNEDKESFMVTLLRHKERYRFRLYGYVLMDNHVHLVISPKDGGANISKIMQAITLSYSRKYRYTHDYSGYVWAGRFKSNVIASERYIHQCLEYIHNNPVRAGIVRYAKEYYWSSHRVYGREYAKVPNDGHGLVDALVV
jgi:putative transposase